MFTYFSIYIYLLLLSILDFCVKKNKIYDILYSLFALIIIFLAGFRGMGNDYDGYRQIFEETRSLSLLQIFDPHMSYVEPCYAILNIIMRCAPYQAVLFVMALLNVSILWPFIKRYSPYPYMSLLFFAGMFMYTGIMGLIRQHLAIAIAIWAMASYNNRRFWWLILLATLFHYSSAIVVVVKFLSNRFYNIKTYLIIGFIAIISNLMFYGVFKLLINYLPAVIAWKLNIYMGTEAGITFGLNAAVAIRIFTFLLILRYRRNIEESFSNYGALFCNIYFLAIIIYTGFGFLPQMAARGAVFFHYMEIIVVPMVIYVNSKINRVLIFTLYALFSLIRHIEMVTTYAEAYMPYKNVLFN